ncbi:MAG: DNA-directed RNA polymerase subunit beta [Mycobacterium sp.]
MTGERRRIHKPTKFLGRGFEAFHEVEDPVRDRRIAHETAAALMERVRSYPDPEVVARLISYTDEHGIDTIAELWSDADARSLPGALWRVYLLRSAIREDPYSASLLFGRGADVVQSIDPVVAGAAAPTGPTEVSDVADRILRGVFEGDFAIALERAAAYCRVSAAGSVSLAQDAEFTAPERSAELTDRAVWFTRLANELDAAAGLWRSNSLE